MNEIVVDHELLLDQTNTQIFIFIDEQTYYLANKAHADFLGLDKSEFGNVSIYDIFTKDIADYYYKDNEKIFKNKEKTYTIDWFKNSKGVYKLLSITKTPKLGHYGNVEYIICSAEDITEKNQSEKQRKKSEELFREITENMVEMICLTDKDGYFVYAGPSYKSTLGYDPERLIGKSVFNFVHPDDLDRIKDEFNIFLESLTPRKSEYRCLHADGHYLWLETYGNFIYDDAGNIKKIVFTGRDITKRKELEQKLKNSYEIINNSRVVAFLWKSDKENGWPVEYVSNNVVDIFGYTVDDFNDNKLSYADIIHPDDINRVKSEVETYSDDPDRLKFQHKPYRIITKTGNIRWVDDRTTIIKNDSGEITHYQGVILDITDRKLAEDRLMENEKMLDDTFESIQDGISIIDTEFNILRTNSKMNEWYRVNTPLEGRKCYEVYHNRSKPCDKCPTYRAFKTGKTEIDILSGLPESKVEWLEVYSYPMNDRYTGEILGVVEFVRDITEKIKTERQLEKYAKELKHMNKELEHRVQKQTEEIKNAERLRVLELHHRIKNNLQVISSLLSLQSEKFNDDTVNEAFRDTQNRVISMSLVHQKIYHTKGLESINVKDYIEDLVEHLISLYNGGNILVNIDIQNAYFGIDTIIPLGMLINELVSNSLKYAYPEDKNGELNVIFYENNSGCYTLIVSDNGEGIPDDIDLDNPDSLGIQLIKSLVDQINGEFELDSNNGTKFAIYFNI
jgi:PAS domain S-box-containing protein